MLPTVTAPVTGAGVTGAGVTGARTDRFLRFGYVARGFLHAGVALLVATVMLGAPATAWLEFLLGALGVGFGGYAAWRLLLAVRNPARAPLPSRVRYVLAASAYGLLAYETFALLVSGGTGAGTLTSALLAQPSGAAALQVVGVAVVAFGVAQFGRAASGGYLCQLPRGTDPQHREVFRTAGAVALAARGMSAWVIGGLLVLAGDPSSATPDEVLARLRDAALGPWLLLAVALALLTYGLYSVARGLYRQVPGAYAS